MERLALLDIVDPELADRLDGSLYERINALREQPDARARIQRVWNDAMDIWRDPEDVTDFLFRKHSMLDDCSPIDVALGSEHGAEKVHDILGRLRYSSAA